MDGVFVQGVWHMIDEVATEARSIPLADLSACA